MPTTPITSERITGGIRVNAKPVYLPEESDSTEPRYVFAYTITIFNEGTIAARLISRHWVIIDGLGRRQDVNGPGVVGETPRIEPGRSYSYQSFCHLRTPWGTMEGEYQMRRDDGESFDAEIARFYLHSQKE